MIQRTIFAAARAGNLVYLGCTGRVRVPFATPSLIPAWVNLQNGMRDSNVYESSWYGAAKHLRPVLAHASRWLGVQSSAAGPRPTRLLHQEDIQSLRSYFKKRDSGIMPYQLLEDRLKGFAIWRYFPLLEGDSRLAQQVANAWNLIVERGEADIVKCICRKCRESTAHQAWIDGEEELSYWLEEESSEEESD